MLIIFQFFHFFLAAVVFLVAPPFFSKLLDGLLSPLFDDFYPFSDEASIYFINNK
jgi:hypothetical protein